MKLIRLYEGSKPLAGIVKGNDVHIYESLGPDPFHEYISMRQPDGLPLQDFLLELIGNSVPVSYKLDWISDRFIMPMIPAEVWAAGVTYRRSATAREEETEIKGIYDRVYEAKRPELLFKGLGYRTVGPNDIICLRRDSAWNVPEPEFALVFGEREIAGYMIGNDVSSRDIEGANPLYLPQAKIWRNSCSIGPYLVTPDELENPKNVGIKLTIYRDREIAFSGDTNTFQMKRSFEELSEHLFRDNPIPRGTILLTGVGVVPPDEFTLHDGDLVEIEMDELGIMKNRVRQL